MPIENLSVDFINKNIGGFLGIGETQCGAKITFNKNQFFAGSIASALVDVDNTKASQAVDFYQLMLIQRISTI